jgi:hypothetical protein
MKTVKLIERKLEGLYVNQVVNNKYKNLSNDEKRMIREKNKQYAVSLDELEVPWKIQNKIAFEATKPENWEIYNKDVIRKALKSV